MANIITGNIFIPIPWNFYMITLAIDPVKYDFALTRPGIYDRVRDLRLLKKEMSQ